MSTLQLFNGIFFIFYFIKMNKKLFHKRYYDYMTKGKSYNVRNPHDDHIFTKHNDSIIEFCKEVNNIGNRELSEFQLDIIKTFYPYVVQKFFKDQWSKHKDSIVDLYGFTSEDIYARKLLSYTARREGKTTVYVHICVAALLTFPLINGVCLNIALPAQKQLTSRETLEKIKTDLMMHPNFDKNGVLINNADVFRYRPKGCIKGYVECHAFPGGKVSIS